MALEFRQRIFVVLVALTAVPTALAVVGWALAVRTVGPSAGGRAPVAPAVASDRRAGRVDPSDPAARAAARGSREPRGAGVRGAAPGAARACDRARCRPRA